MVVFQPGKWLPSGKHTKNYGKSPFLMGKSTISMAIFNSYVKLPEGISYELMIQLSTLGVDTANLG